MIFRTITDDITGANKSIGLFGMSLNDISDKLYDIQTKGFKNTIFNTPTIEFDEKAIAIYNQAIEKNISHQKALEIASKGTNRATITLMESANGATISTEQMTAAQKASTVAAKAQSVAYKAVSIAANMIAYALIAKGLQLAADAIDHYVNRAKYAAEAMEEAQQAIDDAQSSLKNVFTTLSENKDRFLELSQGVDKFSKNLSLSEEDYAEYLSISNQLAELSPSLVSGYDEQGNALLAIGKNADETNEKLQSVLENQQAIAQQTLIDNMDDVATGIYYEVEDAKSSIESMETELASLQDQFKEVNVDIASSNGLISFSDDDYSKYGKAMENALTSAGIEFEKNASAGLYTTAIQLVSASPQQLEQAQKFYDAWLNSENEYYHASENGLKQDIEEKEKSIETSYAKMTANLQAWVKDNYNYQYLSDDASAMVDALIPEIKWDELEEAPITASDYQNYVEENIIKPLMEVPQEHKQEIDNMLQQLLSFEDGDLDVLEFAEQLQARLKELGITIDITPIIADEQEAKDKLQNSIEAIAEGGSSDFTTSSGVKVDADDYKTLQEYTKDFTSDQIELWNKSTLGAENATDAINKYEEALKSASNPDEITVFSDFFSLEDAEGKTTALGNLNDQIDELQKAYTGLKEAMDSYKETGTFTLDQVQEIISYGGEYLKYLMDENGNLQLNEEALNNVAIARINEMRVKALSNLMDNLDSITNEASALEYLKQQLIDTAEGYDEITESRINAWLSNTLESNITDSTRESLLASFRNQANAINEMFDNISIGSIGGSSTKDEEKSAKDYVDSYMEFMKSSLETNRIDFRTYSNDVSAFLKKMFDEGKISGKEYFDYVQEQLETEKKIMDAVISAVTYRIDEEIDRLKSEQDEIQNTIDALREANDEKERALELEKARYELARLQSQRTKYVYDGERGFIYKTDDKAIREAQEKLKDLEFEEIIKGLENEKEALNDSIEELEKYKDKWNNIQKQHEININKMHAKDILGQNWEKDILVGRIDTLNNFASNYFNIQKAIADAAWNSANEQNKAMQSISTGGNVVGKPDTPTPTNNSNIQIKPKVSGGYKVTTGGVDAARGFLTKKEADDWARSHGIFNYQTPSDTVYEVYLNGSLQATKGSEKEAKEYLKQRYGITQFAKGGVIGNDKSQLDYIAKYLGEDHVIVGSEGERVLTTSQNDNFEKLVNMSSDLIRTLQPFNYGMITPDFSKLATRNNSNNVVMNVSLNCPNVTNESGFKYIERELSLLPTRALQYNWKD